MRESTGLYPRVRVNAAGSGVVSVSHAGSALLIDTIRAAGLDRALSGPLSPWRASTATHDPAKILLDLAVSLAVGGACLADIAVLREAPEVFGPVASDPTGWSCRRGKRSTFLVRTRRLSRVSWKLR